ncbi:MAG TPA: hypothetical protein VFJ61_09960 [Solirubrobacterales bacterium]|nr:hypothetical protein [Solirubrobacterales bacterium]
MNNWLRSLLGAMAAFCALGALAPAAALAGSIGGTVTAADTHGPLAGVEACAYLRSEGVEGNGGCRFTDAAGGYTIEELVPAEYEVWFRANGTTYVAEPYPGRIAVASGAVTGIDAELAVGGRIEGTITRAATGEPVAASVCIGGLSPGAFGGCTGSGSDGRYALTVAAGEYRVEFEPFEGVFIPQYFDHVDHEWAATPVVVSAGEIRSGIDAALGVGGRITGTVRLRDGGTPLSGAGVCAWEASGLTNTGDCDLTAADGTYALERLPGADYKVEFSAPEGLGLQPQVWNEKPGWNEGDLVHVAGEATIGGIDAYLAVRQPPPPLASPSQVLLSVPILKKLRLHCRKGFHKRRVRGKLRCVKKHPRHHRRRR